MQWAPGIQDQSANIIMQGNAMAQRSGEDITKIAGYFMDRANKSKALGQTIMAYGGTDENGDPTYDKKMLDGMSVDEKEGLLTGMHLANQLKGQQAMAEEQRARGEEYKAMAAERQDRIDQAESQGNAISRYFQAPDVPTAAPTDTDTADPSAGNTGGVVMRTPNHFERIAYALGPEGVSGKFAAPTIKALNDLQDMSESDPEAKWDTYYPKDSPFMMVSKRGTHQSYMLPLTGQGPPTASVGGQDYYLGKHWTANPPQPGAGKMVGGYPDLERLYGLATKMEGTLDKFSLTPERRAAHQKALDRVYNQINRLEQQLGNDTGDEEGAGTERDGEAPAAGAGGPVTKGNTTPPAMQKVTTQKAFDALPPGASYIGKGDRVYTKPKKPKA